MQGGGGVFSGAVTDGSSFISGGDSSTLWSFGDEDLGDDSTRVIWKASQPQDPALNRLMEEAYAPRKPPRVKSWTPSPNSYTFASAPASASTSNVAERSAKSHRSKRRASSTTPVQEAPSSMRQDSTFDKDIQRLIALLPIVSKQADENARRENEALQEKRRQKKAARILAESSSVAKKRRSPTDVKGKQRVADVDREEEEIILAEEPFDGKRLLPGGSSSQNGVTHSSNTTQNMPPPPFVPLRRARSDNGSFSNPCLNQHEQLRQGRQKPGPSPEELSFFPASFVATSTPRPPLPAGPANSADNPCSDEGLIRGRDRYPMPNGTPTSAPAPKPSDGANSQLHHRTSSLFPGKNHVSHQGPKPTTHPNLNPHPHPNSNPETFNSSSQAPAPTPVPRAQTLPKSNRPPVLGMRRLPHLSSSQVFPLSQDRPLPVKRDKFRVPFAKPGLSMAATPTKPYAEEPKRYQSQNQGKPTIPGGSQQKHDPRTSSSPTLTQGNTPTPMPTSTLRVPALAPQPSHPARQSQSQSQSSSSSSSPSYLSANHSEVVGQNTNPTPRADPQPRYSPPPAVVDPDSSIEYDMDIDPEELERVCSAYD